LPITSSLALHFAIGHLFVVRPQADYSDVEIRRRRHVHACYNIICQKTRNPYRIIKTSHDISHKISATQYIRPRQHGSTPMLLSVVYSQYTCTYTSLVCECPRAAYCIKSHDRIKHRSFAYKAIIILPIKLYNNVKQVHSEQNTIYTGSCHVRFRFIAKTQNHNVKHHNS